MTSLSNLGGYTRCSRLKPQIQTHNLLISFDTLAAFTQTHTHTVFKATHTHFFKTSVLSPEKIYYYT